MRPSKRSEILDAALEVVETGGVTAVTFESVAAAAGVTKGGLLYHFPSRDALVHAMHVHLAERWESQLEAAAGTPWESTDADDRCRAYTAVAIESATRAELLLMLDASADAHTDANAVCSGVIRRWAAPAPDGSAPAPDALDRFVARLAADGLWLHDALGGPPLDPEVRRLVASRLADPSIAPEAGTPPTGTTGPEPASATAPKTETGTGTPTGDTTDELSAGAETP